MPEELRRAEPPRLPELAEPEILRHFTALSNRNFGIDTGFYPLGSCTMKYNPRINERLVGLPGFAHLHPLQEEDGAQGALELMWRLQEILAEVTGLHAVSLQPAAGSQGELTGLMLMHAYFADRGEDEQRRKIVIPDTAHGTNPASVTMAGYELTPVRTDARGNIDVDDLRDKVDEHTAGLMLTNPSTLGLFDENIEEITRIFHRAGALMYYDGANLNAVCGISRPGDMGFDIVHINLHKTFSQPHGGGGPGGGPIAVRDMLEPFLPVPVVLRDGDDVQARTRPAEVDRQGARLHGPVRRLRPVLRVHPNATGRACARCPRSPSSTPTTCWSGSATTTTCRSTASACTSSCSPRARSSASTAITATDVAKRLMDYGFHPPTVYFPLVVPEALMIEPTETEPKETLDAFADAMIAIAREAAEEPETVKNAPTSRPVRRVDEVKAAKHPVVRYLFDEHPTGRAEPVTSEPLARP